MVVTTQIIECRVDIDTIDLHASITNVQRGCEELEDTIELQRIGEELGSVESLICPQLYLHRGNAVSRSTLAACINDIIKGSSGDCFGAHLALLYVEFETSSSIRHQNSSSAELY